MSSSACSSPASASVPAMPVAQGLGIPCAVLLQIHDEASLRLRSSADTDGSAPSRSRSSKVQQHVTSLHFPSQPDLKWYAELDALSGKSAAVLAHSLHRLLRAVASSVCPALTAGGTVGQAWFFHILVGVFILFHFLN